ncbi:MAG: DNA repair protein RadA [Deltaproteobacteria bacterium]|nr:MAG: DNA repair protein RadA [Deltaproteobacteria bacterium]
MGKKPQSIYICQGCGYQAPKWMGRCPDCGQWNSLVETVMHPSKGHRENISCAGPQAINQIIIHPEIRIQTGIAEFDRILGGGVVSGSLVLIGGEPGIGKSTLVLQVLNQLAERRLKALYITGEESLQQIKMRASRLQISSDHLYVLTATCIEDCFRKIEELKPDIMAVDSIQTMYTEDLSSTPGTVGQIREVSAKLMAFGKTSQTPIFLIGHVTKEGAIAGPKVLEHLVDTVLYFEGDSNHIYRILRSVKNRYGSTNEIGVFEMRDKGLEEVGNPSRLFLQERPEGASGSVVIPCLEGTRPLLLEVQALVGASSFGVPRRTCIGIDPHRVSLLVAILGKRLGLELGDQDIFVNVTGGLRLEEPASDLGIVSALLSSFLNRPVDMDMVIFGEVGLAGEVRGVSQPELRIKEAARLGFTKCIVSKNSLAKSPSAFDMEILEVGSVQELYENLFMGSS